MKRALLLLVPSVMFAVACAQSAVAPGTAPTAAAPEPLDINHDYHSYANTAAFRTRHLVLDLTVDFARRVLEGSVELQLQRLSAGAVELVLDTRDLDVAGVEAAVGQGAWQVAAYRVDARDPMLGSPLRIALPPDTDRVRIRYATRPEASGLQWVTPEQTAG